MVSSDFDLKSQISGYFENSILGNGHYLQAGGVLVDFREGYEMKKQACHYKIYIVAMVMTSFNLLFLPFAQKLVPNERINRSLLASFARSQAFKFDFPFYVYLSEHFVNSLILNLKKQT